MGKFQTPCILVVTDEPLIRHMVARLLASEGLWAVTAEHGEADFEGFARIPIALIIVNTYRPDLIPAEIRARVNAAFPGVPVLHLEEGLSGFSVDGFLQSVRTLTHTERRQVARPTLPSREPGLRSVSTPDASAVRTHAPSRAFPPLAIAARHSPAG
jgi:CheY-like chemotaxis protein